MEWVRGEVIGHGCFSTVNLATTSSSSGRFAVKSADFADASFLRHEKQVLDDVGAHRNVIQCLGADVTTEGERMFNLLLEYAPGGTMAERVRKSGGKLAEKDVRGYAKQVLRGLAHVHKRGFAHLDIKPDNLLLSESGEVKIADFGLAKRVVDARGCSGAEIRGTPMYMAPESVNDNEYGPACDVWAVGCSVVEMASGRPAWGTTGKNKRNINMAALLIRIGVGDETPAIPEDMSEEGKDFLRMCFMKDPRMRWTAEMLLDHPFLCGVDEEVNGCHDNDTVSVTPRCVFDFPEEWSTGSWSSSDRSSDDWDSAVGLVDLAAVEERVRRLAGDGGRCGWVDSGSWINVR